MTSRRRYSREYKVEAVRLVTERGVSVAQAARDLGLHANSLRKWVQDYQADPRHAFPGEGQQKPEAAELTSGPRRGGSTSPSSWICSRAAWWAGPCSRR